MKKKIFCRNAVLDKNAIEKLGNAGISEKYLRYFFPTFLLEKKEVECSYLEKCVISLYQYFVVGVVNIFLKPRKEKSGHLDMKEVEQVYNREAFTYDFKHHLTTCGQDMIWRRLAGWIGSLIFNERRKAIKVLDLCTGTGLCVQEMVKVLEQWGAEGTIIGLDYNNLMLSVARKRKFDTSGIEVRFVRGDAMNFAELKNETDSEFFSSGHNSFDLVTQIFGIGGISHPLKTFREVLKVLKPNGRFLLADVHEPIKGLPGELFGIYKFWQMPKMEAYVYFKTIIPLILNRLWAWRDTTLDFYLLPLVSYEESGKYWSYNVLYFEVIPERWWLSLPIMSVGRMLAQKVEISEDEARKRECLLTVLNQ